MNLHGIVQGSVAAINPQTLVTIQTSTGYTSGAGGVRTPTFVTTTGYMDVQDLSTKDLQHIQGLNLSGMSKKVWANGSLNSVLRAAQTGGDLLTFGGYTWKVTHVVEQWDTWCAVIVTMLSPGS